MKLSKYEKLKQKLEVLKLEKNFFALNTTLYWFSFLGNIFLIYFGYFFIKSITDAIPSIFPFQDTFFTVFIALFLTGYELTKRFIIDQTSVSIITDRRATSGIVTGAIASLLMIAGSFYLSIKGAHRLVDNTEKIYTLVDSSTSKATDSISKYYEKEIAYYRSQPARTRVDRQYRDSIVLSLQAAKEQKIQQIESKTQSKSNIAVSRNKENDTAFLIITVFLELIVLLGVSFNSYYTVGSYQETGKLLQTSKYKQYVLNLNLLKIYYNNGKKKSGDMCISHARFVSLAKTQKVNASPSDIKDFVNLCVELEIVEDTRNKRKQYKVNYEEAKSLLQKDEAL